MERVLILTGDAGEELEVYYMLYRLREAGYQVDVAAPERKRSSSSSTTSSLAGTPTSSGRDEDWTPIWPSPTSSPSATWPCSFPAGARRR